jgi:ATP dependent DNA ligase C terminal region
VAGVAHAVARAKEGHNVIRSNVLAAFVPAGKQRGCRATSVNTGVPTGPDTIRYPDVVVDCGPRNALAMTASKVGTGWSRTVSSQIRKQLDTVVSPKSKLTKQVKKPKATWVEPTFFADVEFRDITSEGLLRQSSFKGLSRK